MRQVHVVEHVDGRSAPLGRGVYRAVGLDGRLFLVGPYLDDGECQEEMTRALDMVREFVRESTRKEAKP